MHCVKIKGKAECPNGHSKGSPSALSVVSSKVSGPASMVESVNWYVWCRSDEAVNECAYGIIGDALVACSVEECVATSFVFVSKVLLWAVVKAVTFTESS